MAFPFGDLLGEESRRRLLDQLKQSTQSTLFPRTDVPNLPGVEQPEQPQPEPIPDTNVGTGPTTGRTTIGSIPGSVPPGNTVPPVESPPTTTPPTTGTTPPAESGSKIPSTTLKQPPNGDWMSWFFSVTRDAGLPANRDTLLKLEPTLKEYGIEVLRNASKQVSGKIRLPDGRVIDVGRAFGAGGGGPDFWQWLESSATINELPGSGGGIEFTDFWGSKFEDAIMERLNQLREKPDRTQLNAFIESLLDAVQGKEESTDELVGGLRGRIGQLENTDTELIQKMRERAGELRDPNQTPLASALRSRIGELREAPYTDQQEAALRAKAFDQFERRRQETLKNEREGVYARGFAPTSGLAKEAEYRTNDRFEQARTGIEADLLLDSIQEMQRRRDKATQLEVMFDDLINSRRDQALGLFGGIDEDIEGRRDKATGLLGMIEDALSEAGQTRTGYLGEAANIEDRTFQDDEARQREILTTLGLPLDLMNQRQQLLNQTAGIDANPNNIVASILGILGFNQQNRQFRQTQENNNSQGMGELLSLLFSNLGKVRS